MEARDKRDVQEAQRGRDREREIEVLQDRVLQDARREGVQCKRRGGQGWEDGRGKEGGTRRGVGVVVMLQGLPCWGVWLGYNDYRDVGAGVVIGYNGYLAGVWEEV
jgi:hypothetical protein